LLLGVLLLSWWMPHASSAEGTNTRSYLRRPDAWFASAPATIIASNILSYEALTGGWPKNINTTTGLFSGSRAEVRASFDNGATTDELRFLARAYLATSNGTFRDAFHRGCDYILKAQYTNGGWPQFFPPPRDKYHRHITFNDGVTVQLATFVREVAREDLYQFAGIERRAACAQAFENAVQCILRCQVRLGDQLTAWCAQHDEVTFQPRPGRSFELVSLSGSESVGIVRLLMSIEQPSPEVMRAIEAAVAWLESAKLSGIRVEQQPAPGTRKGSDRVVMKDANAKPMWARFYEIGNNRPIFAGRDGVKKYSLAAIDYERRNGYAWLGYWPETLLKEEWPAWKARQKKAR
jgi:PelA/Pel-15E family pectate lyase